jgi:hypothetical protein
MALHRGCEASRRLAPRAPTIDRPSGATLSAGYPTDPIRVLLDDYRMYSTRHTHGLRAQRSQRFWQRLSHRLLFMCRLTPTENSIFQIDLILV